MGLTGVDNSVVGCRNVGLQSCSGKTILTYNSTDCQEIVLKCIIYNNTKSKPTERFLMTSVDPAKEIHVYFH